jgi:hypothetical protein
VASSLRVARAPSRRYPVETLPGSHRHRPGPRGRPFSIALAALAAALAGCGGGGAEPPASPTTCPIPVAVAAPTFSGHVLPALRASCGAGSAISCHGDNPLVGHVSFAPSLSAAQVRDQLVGVVPSSAPSSAPTGRRWERVAAGDPSSSWLLEKVRKDDPGGVGLAYGNRMPLGLPNLCDPTVQTFTTWIALGAHDD